MSANKPKRCITLIADGARPDVFEDLLNRGQLPNLQRLLHLGGSHTVAATVFPSTSGPAYLPMLTGCHPGTCNVPGFRWFERGLNDQRTINRALRSYIGLGGHYLRFDVDPQLASLADLAPNSQIIASGIDASATPNTWPTLYDSVFLISYMLRKYNLLDSLSAFDVLKAIPSGTAAIFAVLHAIDAYTHRANPTAPNVIKSYTALDKLVGKIIDLTIGRGEDCTILITSDHGLTTTHTHIDLAARLAQMGYAVYGFPGVFSEWRPFTNRTGQILQQADCICAVSGNSMANLYFKHDNGWREPTWIEDLEITINSLLEIEGIDIVAGKSRAGGLQAFSRAGRATIKYDGAQIHYHVPDSDPFGYGSLPEAIPIDSILPLTIDTDYPDAPLQLLRIFNASRAGDLVISAANGYDLRTQEFPVHYASHGSLRREHMLVPLISNRPLRTANNRTVDVFPSILEAIGIPATGLQIEGHSLLLPQGK